MIKPIKKYDGYFYEFASKRLFGLSEETVTHIEIIDQDGDIVEINDFFTKGGVLFFAIGEIEIDKVKIEKEKEKKETTATMEDEEIDVEKTVIHFYQQKDENISEIKELPERPKKNRAHYDSDEFTITDAEYEKDNYSDVRNIVTTSGLERFFHVDGFMHYAGSGMFFNVSSGRKNEQITVRPEGLYHWGVKNKQIVYLIGDGSLYK